MNGDFYNQDYYERGIESGKSCYQNYRWVPELTVPMAMTIIEFLGLKRQDQILDFGCAKGYLVKALRMLHRQAWGVDISDYALSQVPSDTAEYCCLAGGGPSFFPRMYDYGIAKDVFEHIPEEELPTVLQELPAVFLFAVIPLGDKGVYRAKANNFDTSHVVCKDEKWWEQMFLQNNWTLHWKGFRVDGIKDSYYPHSPTGHGFFILKKVR
jgi:SAM-dependent methyltransferase